MNLIRKVVNNYCVCFLNILNVCSATIGCLDGNGNPVDWFVVYKLPENPDSSSSWIQQGFGQMYMDVNNQHWTLSKESIGGKDHAVYNTLQQIYAGESKSDLAYLLYNDEKPAGHSSSTHGHTKGDIAFDSTTGFWLVHSVPLFPPLSNESYGYPDTGRKYGQTFLCITYDYKYFDVIGQQLLYTYPQIYDDSFPESFASNVNMANAINGQHVKTAPWTSVEKMTSLDGQQFISFAKFGTFGLDLYDHLVAPSLSSSLYVESWQSGAGGKLPSTCDTKLKVMNVESVEILGESFEEHSDHSKWASSADESTWICIGDINRMQSQEKRHGGTVCASLPKIWNAFNSSITSAARCSNHRDL